MHFAGKRNVVIGAGSLKGVFVDDAQLANKGTWTYSNSKSPFVEYGYRHDNNAQKGELSAVFSVKLPKSGTYEVRMCYTADPNRATNVPVTIQHAAGKANVVVNQRKRPEHRGKFHSLGAYEFKTGQPAAVTISNKNTDGYVIIDCIQWLPKP